MFVVRFGPLLLTAAATSATAHALGILLAQPVWRHAEVLSLGLLLGYAVVSGPPAPRWVVPAALVAPLVDAVRTMPAAGDTGGYRWQVLRPGEDFDVPSGFESGLALCWASITMVVLLLPICRRAADRRRPVVIAAVMSVLVIGYVVVRVVDIRLAVRAEQGRSSGGTDPDAAATAVVLAVLAPVALGLLAAALATASAGIGRQPALAGAVLLGVVALARVDASIDAVLLPLYAGERTALFASDAVTPTVSMPQPVPALTAAVEFVSYLLLVAGLTGSRRPAGAVPAEADGQA